LSVSSAYHPEIERAEKVAEIIDAIYGRPSASKEELIKQP
jgi:hypothetical protein